MRRHDIAIIENLKIDRGRGMSLSALVRKYSLPKTTIWHHVRNVELTEADRRLIRSYQGGTKLESQREWVRAKQQAVSILDRFDAEIVWPAILAALYWSEGTKRGGFVFTNTDELMIRVFLRIMRERLKIEDSSLDIMIRTCTPMDPKRCRKYWSEVTGVSYRDVRINHNDKQNKSKTTYGMCRITLRKGGYSLKLVHCLIREIADKMIHVDSSRSSTDRTSHS